MTVDNFKELLNDVRPALIKISSKRRPLGFIDRDDLYQEAMINLWLRLGKGEFRDKTKSYIIKSCYFHIQNYIRTHKPKDFLVSLDEPVAHEPDGESGGILLKDILESKEADLAESCSDRLVIDGIMNNGLTLREKEVFRFLYQGLTIREIARKLGISHVRVLKIKQHISEKYREKAIDS